MMNNNVMVGDVIEVVGMGKMFVDLVEGAEGVGEVLHYSYNGEVVSTTDFPEKEDYEVVFPEQTSHGLYYRDIGTDQVLWVAVDDFILLREVN